MSELKNLTMKQIKKEASKYNEKEEYQLDDKYKIEFYPFFSYEKIDELVEEYQNDLKYSEEKGINLASSDYFVYKYLMFLAVKHFTDLGKQISNKVEEKVIQLKHLNSTGYLNQIVDEVFLVEELNKVYDRISDLTSANIFLENVSKNTLARTEELRYKYRDILEEIENPEVKTAKN